MIKQRIAEGLLWLLAMSVPTLLTVGVWWLLCLP